MLKAIDDSRDRAAQRRIVGVGPIEGYDGRVHSDEQQEVEVLCEVQVEVEVSPTTG